MQAQPRILGQIVLMVLFLAPVHQSRAQTVYSKPQLVQYFQSLTTAAQEAMEHGEVSEAKRLIIAGIPIYRIFTKTLEVPVAEETLRAFKTTHDRAWKEDATPKPEDVETLMVMLEKRQHKINLMRKEFETATELWPKGAKQFRLFIANMLAQKNVAKARCRELADAVPPPLHLLEDQARYESLNKSLFEPLFNVAFGPGLAEAFARDKVVPDTLKDVEGQLSRVKNISNPALVHAAIWQLEENLRVLAIIDAALRSEDTAIEDLEGRIATISAGIQVETERANKLFDERVATNRMPTEVWRSGPRTAIVGSIERAYRASNPADAVQKIAVLSPAPERQWEIFWSKDRYITQFAMYVKAAVAVKQPDGTHRVHFNWYKRVRRGTERAWSGWTYDVPAGNHMILAENLGS